MKVERTQLGLASASKQISRFASSRRVDEANGVTYDDSEKRHKKSKEETQEEESTSSQGDTKSDATRLLNITA